METWSDVRRQLDRFTKVMLINNVRKLAIFQPSYLYLDDTLRDLLKCTKASLVEMYTKELKKFALSSVVMGHLGLYYCYLKASRRLWTVYQLERKSIVVDMTSQSLEVLQQELETKLERSYKMNTTFHLYDGAFWVRLATRSRRRRALSASVIYVVHFSHSSCLGVTALKKTDAMHILKALGFVFKFKDSSITALQGKHLYSLFRLFSEKEFSQFHLQRKYENPIAAIQHLPVQHETVPDSRIHDCEREDKKKSEQYGAEQYGETDIPVITKLTYQLRTDFRGLQSAPKMAESREDFFNVKIVFEGPNILEGFKQMVKSGIATTPLPEYVANVRTLGKTKFLITTRRSANAVDS